MSEPAEAEPIPLSARLRVGAREAWHSALGLLYPPTCIACQAALVCIACHAALV